MSFTAIRNQKMNVAEAKAVLLRHCYGGREDDTLPWCLCPYTGGERRHLLQILQALTVVAPELNGPQLDRDLVRTIWDLCRTIRNWARQIPPEAKKSLDEWIDEFEAITLHLLRGQPAVLAFGGVADLILKYRLGAEAAFLVPLLSEKLRLHQLDDPTGENSDDEDPVSVCLALESMGLAAAAAWPALLAAKNTNPHTRVRESAAHALAAVAGST